MKPAEILAVNDEARARWEYEQAERKDEATA
jgi:hypothetical protein